MESYSAMWLALGQTDQNICILSFNAVPRLPLNWPSRDGGSDEFDHRPMSDLTCRTDISGGQGSSQEAS